MTALHPLLRRLGSFLLSLRQHLALGLGLSSSVASSLGSILARLMIVNYLGLVPYCFTITSQLVFNISVAFLLWLASLSNGYLNSFNSRIAHLVPLGSPPVLMPFIVLVESVSIVIRPLTLAVRLMANIVAGHLLLSLAGTAVLISSAAIVRVYLLLVLELAVAAIQAYVFCVLLSLYTAESRYRGLVARYRRSEY